jgi:PAS domain S-box-containing protein
MAIDITDRLRAEEASREANATLRSFYDTAPMMMGVVEVDEGDILHLTDNAATAAFFGRRPEALHRRLASQLGVPGETIREWIRRYRESERTGVPVRFEYPHRTEEGTRWLSATVYCIERLTEGRIRGSYVVEDVTERKRAGEEIVRLNQELARRVDELQAILDIVPIGIGIAHDPECRRITFNPYMSEVLGVPRWENASLTAAPDERPDSYRVYRDGEEVPPDRLPMQVACTGVEVRDSEVDVVRAGDGTRQLLCHVRPLLDGAGRVRGSVGAFLDITSRRRIEEALRRSEAQSRRQSERLREVAVASCMIHSATTAADVLRIATEEARRIIGTHQAVSSSTVNEQSAQAINAVSLSDEYARWRAYDARPDGTRIDSLVCRTNKPMRLTQAELEAHPGFGREAGDHTPLRGWLAAPFVGRDGRNLGVIQLSDKLDGGDFTADDEAILVQLATIASVALENARLYGGLREADRRKDEFLATLAHELRNPLAPIRNAVELMRLSNGEAALRDEARSMMERQVAQLVRLVDDLLDISRITRGKLRLRREPVELTTMVRGAVEAARPCIDAQGHRLSVTLPPGPTHLDADPTRLSQVLSNLLTNAAKYTERGGHIGLAAEREGGDVVVSVRDTGIGIAAEHLAHIFEMFSQVDPALERSQGGLGIGLALVRGLVELHGGSVEARSGGPGRGSEFTVRLPIVEVPAQARREPGGDGKGCPAGPKCRILVVDDNGDAARSLAKVLKILGHDVQTAHDGLEAVQAAATLRPDLVLLDLGMPRMNGYEAARHIRQQPWGRGIFIVALTGWGQDDDRRRSHEAGFDRHLVKPIEPAALAALLESVALRNAE